MTLTPDEFERQAYITGDVKLAAVYAILIDQEELLDENEHLHDRVNDLEYQITELEDRISELE